MTNRSESRNIFKTLLLVCTILFSNSLYSQTTYRLNDEAYYLFPFPGSAENNPFTNIIIKSTKSFSGIPHPTHLIVESSNKQLISGKTYLKENRHALVFVPDSPFNLGDMITVRLKGTGNYQNGIHDDLVYHFTVKSEILLEKQMGAADSWVSEKHKPYEQQALNDIQLPEGYPFYEMGFQSTPTPNQYYFQASQVGQFFQLITDNNGIPYFYRETPSRCLDFKVNKNGYITYFDASITAYIELDSAYSFRKIYQASIGLDTDNHDLLVTPDNHSWTIGREYIVTDMSQYIECGNEHANVLHYVIQEKDAEGIVVWQWRTFDHFNVMDGDPNQVDFCKAVVNFAHVNSLDLDLDGNVIISSRKLNEVTKIDKTTGEIIWHLGGVNNQFSFVGDPLNGFTDQHMAREDEAGVVTIFDNGNYHQPPHSRGVRYAIDNINMTATYLMGYDNNTPTVVTNPMGSMQTLENGNVVVGWTQNQQEMCLTEYQADGEKVLEMHQSSNTTLRSYRSYKFPWTTTYFYPETDTVDFGFEIVIGTTSNQTTNIINPNNEAIVVSGSYFSNNLFGLQTELPFTIPAQSTAEVNLSFKPLFDGDYTGYAYLMTQNDTSGIALKFTLQGSTLQSGINKKDKPQILVSPNPFQDQLMVQSSKDQETQIIIYSISGYKMIDIKLASQAGYIFQTQDWNPGIYLIKMRSGSNVWQQKAVKF